MSSIAFAATNSVNYYDVDMSTGYMFAYPNSSTGPLTGRYYVGFILNNKASANTNLSVASDNTGYAKVYIKGINGSIAQYTSYSIVSGAIRTGDISVSGCYYAEYVEHSGSRTVNYSNGTSNTDYWLCHYY